MFRDGSYKCGRCGQLDVANGIAEESQRRLAEVGLRKQGAGMVPFRAALSALQPSSILFNSLSLVVGISGWHWVGCGAGNGPAGRFQGRPGIDIDLQILNSLDMDGVL
jgi:hypothetical protein